MAISTVKTLLPLDQFAQVAGIHPLHFNQVAVANIAPGGTCQDPFLQQSWQDADKVGREEIAETIADVENMLMDRLNFSPVPQFFANVPIRYPRPTNPDIFATSIFDIRSLFRAVKLGQGYVITGGVESKVLVTAAAPIVYTDTDGDGYFETATVTATVPSTAQPGEIQLYYPGTGGDVAFQIRPITVSIAPITFVATIKCRREQLVQPNLLYALDTNAVDGLDNTAFLTTADVYRDFNDFTQPQVEFRWEQTPFITGQAAVQFAVQNGAMLVRDYKLGWAALEPAHFDVTQQVFTLDFIQQVRMPDTARVWFLAGWPLDAKGQMDSMFARAITYMTLAELHRPLCQCDALRAFTDFWSYDFAQNSPDRTHQIARANLENPLGTTRAARWVWKNIILRHKLPDNTSSSDFG